MGSKVDRRCKRNAQKYYYSVHSSTFQFVINLFTLHLIFESIIFFFVVLVIESNYLAGAG